MDFIASASDQVSDPGKAFYFIFDGNRLLTGPQNTIPFLDTKAADIICRTPHYFFGRMGGHPCYCTSLSPETKTCDFSSTNLRAFFHRTDDPHRMAAGFARQIMDLHLNFKFCGRCAAPTRAKKKEHARICPSCSQVAYPRISPAIITAVTRQDEILLARGINFPNKKMFSVLAGFVSPSESLEECVKREVYEETRIRVKNVRYTQSQPWPFPDSLMIGFTAQYQSGEIQIDPAEIVEAAWFKANDLPVIPANYTLAGKLIRDFANYTNPIF